MSSALESEPGTTESAVDPVGADGRAGAARAGIAGKAGAAAMPAPAVAPAPLAPHLAVTEQSFRAPRQKPMMRQYELVERVAQYNSDIDEALLNRAYVYSMRKHGDQKRASGDPYFSHPLEVAAILTDMRLDDATIATALLHDVIEDTDATRAEIDHLFGPEIGRLVEGLTKISRLHLVSQEDKQGENLRKLLLAQEELDYYV